MKTEWRASTDPDIKSGTANFTFKDSNKYVTVAFESFAEFSKVCTLLVLAQEEQERKDLDRVEILMRDLIKRL